MATLPETTGCDNCKSKWASCMLQMQQCLAHDSVALAACSGPVTSPRDACSRLLDTLLTAPLGRKIRCDKAVPICSHCRKSHQACFTSRFRLSWPKTADKRRLVLGPTPVA